MAKYVAAFFGAAGLLAIACATGTPSAPDLAARPIGNVDGDAGADAEPAPDPIPPPSYIVGGTVSGLFGRGLVLEDNGADDLSITGNGAFEFRQTVARGSTYNVTVKTQPNNPSQTCTVDSTGTGTITSAHVTNVTVTCTDNKFTVGGHVSGLLGKDLVLVNNNTGDVTVQADGIFTFLAPQDDGASFDVRIKSQPHDPIQTCSVSGGTGMIAGGSVTSVLVNCSDTKFAISGKVTGLAGTGLVLRDNGADDLSITANGTFSFLTPLDNHAPYAVTIAAQPTNKWQTCDVTKGSGNVAGKTVDDVEIACTTNKYKVKANVSGLDGSGLVLQNNGGDDLPIATNGTLEFPTSIESGAGYAVSTLTNPTNKTQICTVGAPASGTIADVDVVVPVTCATPPANVVLNPGFETANANWQCSGRCGFDTAGFAHSGNGNGWVRNDSGWNAIQQTVNVAPNQTYQVSGFVRTSANNTDGYFGIRTTGGQVIAEKKFGSYSAYTQLSVTAPSGSNTSLVVYCGLWANGDTYLQVDDVVVGQ